MESTNITKPQKVENQYKSSVSSRIIGKCPSCHAALSYRDKKITNCLCCGTSIEWDT